MYRVMVGVYIYMFTYLIVDTYRSMMIHADPYSLEISKPYNPNINMDV